MDELPGQGEVFGFKAGFEKGWLSRVKSRLCIDSTSSRNTNLAHVIPFPESEQIARESREKSHIAPEMDMNSPA